MSKKTKKRNKSYTGPGATTAQPVVHRYTAVERSKLGEWWHTRKKLIKTVTITTAVVAGVLYLFYELVRLVF